MRLTSASARAAYLGTAVQTANPGTLLVMLFDRLVLDISRGGDAIAAGDPTSARRQLRHAQEIVLELRSSLDVEGFEGAVELASLYDYLLTRLIRASIDLDPAVVDDCGDIARPLAETWREAATMLAEAS